MGKGERAFWQDRWMQTFAAMWHCLYARVDASEALRGRVRALRWALGEIASRPTTERNPDGDEQAAYSMQLIAKEALLADQPDTKGEGCSTINTSSRVCELGTKGCVTRHGADPEGSELR